MAAGEGPPPNRHHRTKARFGAAPPALDHWT